MKATGRQFTAFLFLWLLAASQGLTQIRIQRHLSVDDGLVYSQVLNIVRDHEGYLWIGTTSGLSRWDGIRFQNFRISDGLRSDDIQTLAVQGDTLIIGTRRGVSLYHHGRFHEHALAGDHIHGILIASDGTRYYATDASGIWIESGDSIRQWGTEQGFVSDRVQCMVQDSAGQIVFGTLDKGIYISKNGELAPFSGDLNRRFPEIRALFIDSSHTLYIGTAEGLILCRSGAPPLRVHDLPGSGVNHIMEDTEGNLIVSTDEGAAFVRNGSVTDVLDSRHGLSNSFVWCTVQGPNGTLFMGTDGGGLCICRPGVFFTYDESTGLPDNSVWAISQLKDGTLAFGTDAGLSLFDGRKWDLRDRSSGLCGDMVLAIHETGTGALVIGTDDGGVSILENGRCRNISDPGDLTSNSVWALAHDIHGTLYAGTYDGGICVIDDRDVTDTLGFDNGRAEAAIVSSLIRADGTILWGTDGQGVLITEDRDLKPFRQVPELEGKTVWSMLETRDGRLMFGTNAYGLLISGQGKTDTIDIGDGLSNNSVLGILEGEDGKLFLTTDNGLNIVDTRSSPVRIRHIQKADGLASNECNQGAYMEDRAGRIWIGTVKGVTCYDPARDCIDPAPPETHITSIQLFDRTIPAEMLARHRFRHFENYFRFEFTGIDFCMPHRVRYRVRLSGIDPHWVETLHPYVQYTNLTQGTYRLEVCSRIEWGPWSRPASLSFIIAPPFWKTWWFITICFLTVTALTLLFLRLKIQRLLALERLRTKIAADLHDDIGSGLSEISIVSQVIARQLPVSVEPDTGRQIRHMGDIARNLIDSMSDIVWLVNPHRDSLHDLLGRLYDSYENLLNSNNILWKSRNIDTLKNIRLDMETRQNLYLIFKEAIHNSIKYSACTEMVLSVDCSHHRLTIEFGDNGRGFDTTKLQRGNGLNNMRKRAAAIGGSLRILSEPGATIVRYEGKC
ncbi:hypothetical protein JW948_16110 [bacterium]|nr:hypothetical protein [bacterium]